MCACLCSVLHKRYHSEDPCTYRCSKCKYIVSTQELLNDHFRQRHDPNRPKNHICDVCGKGFHGAPQLEKHLVSEFTASLFAIPEFIHFSQSLLLISSYTSG